MKRNNLISAMLAGCMLVLSSLACDLSTSKISNIYMATDETGKVKTAAYSKTDGFFVFFDATEVNPNTQFQSRWYALDVPGRDANKPFKVMDYGYSEKQKGLSNIYFQLTSDKDWPAGRYRVEIYMNSVKAGEAQFEVK